MKICKFTQQTDEARVGLLMDDSSVVDLTPLGMLTLETLLESEDPESVTYRISQGMLQRFALEGVKLCAPVDRHEVWAAGVTYSRSKVARMEESEFSASAYDRVYDAARPELFFKSMPHKVVGPGGEVGIRGDSRWNVPEPELALVLNSRGKIVGCTIGNDMSSRDIEGENLLYLPQAKIYNGSCALGPWIQFGASEAEMRQWQIALRIVRDGQPVFSETTKVDRIKRGFDELVNYLFRSQSFPHGAILLTGTGIVPPDTFSLRAGDMIEIEVTGIGLLRNHVAVV